MAGRPLTSRGSLGWIDGELPQEIDGGDHVPILADVVEMTAIDTGDPLVFHGDRLSSFRESTVAQKIRIAEIAGGFPSR